MIKVLFVCHGNICRSPMAEFVFKDMVKKAKLEDKFEIASAGTSSEEHGSTPHPRTIEKLNSVGITVSGKYACQLKKSDYDKYDYFIGMDKYNVSNMLRLFELDSDGKVHLLLEFSDESRSIEDPWYTHDYDTTYNDVVKGCRALLDSLID